MVLTQLLAQKLLSKSIELFKLSKDAYEKAKEKREQCNKKEIYYSQERIQENFTTIFELLVLGVLCFVCGVVRAKWWV